MPMPPPRRLDPILTRPRPPGAELRAPPRPGPAAAGPGYWVAAALIAALGLLAAGVALPILTVRRFVLLAEPVSILDGLALLARDGEWLVAGLVLAFSVVFPAGKILAALAAWVRLRRGGRPPAWIVAGLPALGRWSMLDVFVVALIVFSIKASALGEASVEAAVIPFLAAVGLTALATRTIVRLARRRRRASRRP